MSVGRSALLLPLALGVSDGILNALTLASATVLDGRGLDWDLAVRVGVVGLVSSVFAVYVAEYARLRAGLTRSERELSMSSAGRLAATSLGRQVVRESVTAAAVAGVASFVGAALPLLVGAAVPRHSWLALVVALATLGGLGTVLGGAAGGRRGRWAAVLVVAGAAVGVVGVGLHIT